MTDVSFDPTIEPGALRRWGLCATFVLAAHVVPAIILLRWLGPLDMPAEPPPAAVMIDLAPLPAAPAVAPTEMPPGPEQALAAAAPPEPEAIPLPELPPASRPAVVLPPRPKPHPPRPPHLATLRPEPLPVDRPAPATTAPPAMQAPPAPAPAAPAAGIAAALRSQGMPTWQAMLLGRLEQFKRYPPEAQVRRQQGVATLRFTMDRNGDVLSFSLEKGSGFGALDAEALALLRRAQPLPKPPADVPGEHIELVVPIEFFLKAQG